MKLASIAALSFLLAVGAAMADDIPGLQSKRDFLTMKANVDKAFADRDDKYKELTPDDRKKVTDALDRMNERWQKADDASGMTDSERVAMANDQEVVTSTLEHASADSRLVCERVATIGSNLPKSVCKSVAQRRREQKEAQDAARGGALEGSN